MSTVQFDRSSGGLVLSIVVVSYNTRALLQACLQSIAQAGIRLPIEIIVIDNASSDGSPQMVRDLFPNVRLICNADNRMYSKANNQGIAVAQGDYVLLLNSDTIVHPGCFETLVEFMTSHLKVAAVGPRVLNADGSLQSRGYDLPSIRAAAIGSFSINKVPLPVWLGRVLGLSRNPNPHPHATGWISGCCMLIRRRDLLRIGGLCESLHFYGEEVEWCNRACRRGREIWCVPSATITHLGGGSTKGEIVHQLSEEALRLRNFATLQTRTVGWRKAIAMASVVIAGNLFRYFVAKIACPMRARAFLQHAKWEIKVLRYLLRRKWLPQHSRATECDS